MASLKESFLKRWTARLINLYKVQKGDIVYFKNFEYWQSQGFHITPNHFYSPIPDTSALKNKVFKRQKMSGFDFQEKNQLDFLKKISRYSRELRKIKNLNSRVDTQKDTRYYFENQAFDGSDASIYYGLIRLLKPKRIIEVGSGWSTKIAAQACLKNKNTKLYSVEPLPQPFLARGFPGFTGLIAKKVEDVRLSFFKSLGANDILFIDSSHVVKIGGDVNHIFFKILPILKKGVYVHFHDIFLPFEYPRGWVVGEKRFWSEQYLLHAFMLFNDTYQTVISKNFLTDKHPDKLKKFQGRFAPVGGGSFWIRKIK